MIVRHFIPPPQRRTGGLDTCLSGLDAHLRAAGVDSGFVSGAAFPFGSGNSAGPQIAHFHGLWEPAHWLHAIRVLPRSRVRVVISPHGMLEPWAFQHRGWKKRPVFDLIERPKLRLADRVLATSRMEAENLRKLLPGLPIQELPLGVDAPEDCGSPDFRAGVRAAMGLEQGTRLALFLSRIHPKKGLDMLLAAWLSFAGSPVARRATLCIVGPGDDEYAAHCRTLADACRMQGADVRWVGPVWGDERWRYFAAADLLCLPTLSENFGFVVPEAWIGGTEVLTTDQTPWLDQRGMDGLTITAPETDSIRRALGDWLGREVLNPDRRARLAGWGRAQFAWPALISRYVDFYQSLARFPS